MSQYTFKEGTDYTRKEINFHLHGELQVYLPSYNNKIVCACLKKDLNNDKAPEVVLVGKGSTVIKRARQLSVQGGTIPVFLKRGVNRWEFMGEYFCDGYITDPVVIQKEQVGSGRKGINGVLYFRKKV